MKNIILKSIKIENFKGISTFFTTFSQKTSLFGANASGKTSVFDAVMWLLFDKNSNGKTSFEIRPLNELNEPIHYLEISVEAVINVNGMDRKLKKVQKEDWVKGRGQKEALFKGNTNEFYIDGFPQKQTDYKKFISNLCDEKTFQMITNPLAFPLMNWKDQRKVLESIMPEISESELVAQSKKFEQFAEELKEHTISEILDRDKKARTKAEMNLKELPARLDELNKSLQENPDIEMVQAERTRLQAQLSDINAKLLTESGITEKRQEIEKKINDINREIDSKRWTIEQEHRKQKSEASEKASKIESQIWNVDNQIAANIRALKNANAGIEQATQKREFLLKEYHAILAEEFDESSLFCRYCGQALPPEKIGQAREAFESGKQKRLEENKKSGLSIRQQMDIDTDAVNRIEIENVNLKTKRDSLMKEVSAAVTERDSIADPDYNTPEICKLKQQICDLREKMKNISATDVSVELKQQAQDIQRQIDNCTDRLSAVAFNQTIQRRIAELEQEKTAVMHTIGVLEERIDMLEQLNVLKLNAISESVNRKFKLVKWKLFDMQINGNVIECCSCTYGGVPFAALNTAMKVNAGLDIINTISDIYGVKAPVFIDNRESVTDILDIDNQVINLVVSPIDKKVRVVEE